MSLLLKRGERGFLVGMTGSGKTQNALFQLRHTKLWPIIIFDTKGDDGFFGLAQDKETTGLVKNIREYDAYVKRPYKDFDDYLIVRPNAIELNDQELMDIYCDISYNRLGSAFFYFDELYNWHIVNKSGPWFRAMLTRGRSKGKTVLGGSQRPSAISRFCITEANKLYLHFLSDDRDWKTIGGVVPGIEKQIRERPLGPYQFYFYETGQHGKAQLYDPVPYQSTENIQFFKKKIF